MITTTDTANILYKACQIFGMPVFQAGKVPKGTVGEDGRVVIHTKGQTPEKIWKKGFVEINLFVANTPNGDADLIRLNELERQAVKCLKGAGIEDGTTYRYSVASTVRLENNDLKANYINVKVLFKVINVTE